MIPLYFKNKVFYADALVADSHGYKSGDIVLSETIKTSIIKESIEVNKKVVKLITAKLSLNN